MKRGLTTKFLCLSLILILSMSVVSAGFFSELWNKITGRVTFACTDSDGGLNYTGYGTTCSGTSCYSDSCANSKQLFEFYCGASSVSVKLYNCSIGCLNGACTAASGGTTTPPAPSASISPGTITPPTTTTPETTSTSWLYNSVCEYGNLNEQCSLVPPFYCNNGNLNEQCSLCGCSSGEICQTDETCFPMTIPSTTIPSANVPAPRYSVSPGTTACSRTDTSCGTTPCQDCTATRQYYCKSGTQERWYINQKCVNNRCIWPLETERDVLTIDRSYVVGGIIFHWETLAEGYSVTEEQKINIEQIILQAASLFNSDTYVDTPFDIIGGENGVIVHVFFDKSEISQFASLSSLSQTEVVLHLNPTITNNEQIFSSVVFHEFSHAYDTFFGLQAQKVLMYQDCKNRITTSGQAGFMQCLGEIIGARKADIDRESGESEFKAYTRQLEYLRNILDESDFSNEEIASFYQTFIKYVEIYTGEWKICYGDSGFYCSESNCGSDAIVSGKGFFSESGCQADKGIISEWKVCSDSPENYYCADDCFGEIEITSMQSNLDGCREFISGDAGILYLFKSMEIETEWALCARTGSDLTAASNVYCTQSDCSSNTETVSTFTSGSNCESFRAEIRGGNVWKICTSDFVNLYCTHEDCSDWEYSLSAGLSEIQCSSSLGQSLPTSEETGGGASCDSAVAGGCPSAGDFCRGEVVENFDGCGNPCGGRNTIIGTGDCSGSSGGGGLELTPSVISGFAVGEEGQLSENCGSTPAAEYQCSGTMRQKKTHNGKGCSDGACYDSDWGIWVNNNDCDSTPANRCVPIDKVQTHNGKGCSNGACYDNGWNRAQYTTCTNICENGECTARIDGAGCIRKRACASNVCKLFKCGLRQNTEGCALNSDCASGFCYEFVCGDKRTTGQTCWSNGNCVSNKCRGFLPARCRA